MRIELPMNLNDHELKIDGVRNYRIYELPIEVFCFVMNCSFIQLISNKSYLVQTDK